MYDSIWNPYRPSFTKRLIDFITDLFRICPLKGHKYCSCGNIIPKDAVICTWCGKQHRIPRIK